MFQLANYLFYLLQRSFAEDNVHSLKKLKLCEFSYTNLLSSREPNLFFSFKTTVNADEGLNFFKLFFSHLKTLLNLKIQQTSYSLKLNIMIFIMMKCISGFFLQKSNSLSLSTNLNSVDLLSNVFKLCEGSPCVSVFVRKSNDTVYNQRIYQPIWQPREQHS